MSIVTEAADLRHLSLGRPTADRRNGCEKGEGRREGGKRRRKGMGDEGKGWRVFSPTPTSPSLPCPAGGKGRRERGKGKERREVEEGLGRIGVWQVPRCEADRQGLRQS